MAARTPRSRGAAPRASAKSRRSPASAEVEVVEEAPGLGLDAGLAVLTSVVLVAAIVLVDMLMGRIDKGFFF